jgi:hypothetical protein
MNTLEKAKQKEKKYIKHIGGYFALKEFCQGYNDISREIIKAYKKTFGTCYLIKINDPDNMFTKYTEQEIYNFDCEFIVKVPDEELKKRLSNWLKYSTPNNLSKIYDYIEEVEGEIINWV